MPDIKPAPWYEKAAYAMVRNGYTLFIWANEEGKGLTKTDCDVIGKTKEFQACLRAERNKFYKELANDPTRSRTTAVGQLVFAIQKMLDAEQFDKATVALGQLFKAEGWTQDAAQISIFNDLNSKDFESLRKRLQGQNADTTRPN